MRRASASFTRISTLSFSVAIPCPEKAFNKTGHYTLLPYQFFTLGRAATIAEDAFFGFQLALERVPIQAARQFLSA
jgi:hypothetical protein